MNRTNEKIAKLAHQAAAIMNDQEEFLIPMVAEKLRQAAKTHPQDRTILTAADVLTRAEDNKKLLITRAEIKDLYNKLYTNHTAFAEVCAEELGQLPEKKSAQYAIKNANEGKTFNLYEGADKTLTTSLDRVLEKKASNHLFNRDAAERAKFAVSMSLEAWNLKASKLDVPAGNEQFIVVQADYQTPKGVTSVLVPVQMEQGQASLPEVFMGNDGPQELNHANLKHYVLSHAGTKLTVRSGDVVQVLTQGTTPKTETNSVASAVSKLAVSRSTKVPFYGDAVLGQKVTELGKPDLTVEKAAQFDSFAEKLSSPLGYANMQFGIEKVNLGRDVVLRTLASFGLKNSQVKLASADATTIVYAVSLNDGRLAFNVPVKFANNRVINPEVLICNGSLRPLTATSIRTLAAANAQDYKAAAACSPQYGLKPSDLMDNIRSAMEEQNYKKAEDALNVLAVSGNQQAYQAAFTIYQAGLSKQASVKEEGAGCKLVVSSPNSQHPICGHTNLPVHKVYQDQHGHCQPLYRRAQSENYEVPTFVNSKIFG